MTISKFRAWDPHEKKMVDDTELVIWGGNIYQGNRQKIFERIVEGKKGLIGYSIDDKYLMQSTGLFDKNGKEIFEGDVVQFEDCYIESDFLYINKGIVEWSQGRFTVTNRDSVEMEDLLDGELLDVTIIGNIYENPELMEDNA
ncbi:hypothetical protein HMPREF9682_00799 [Streptococcus intermedius F0395]|nr:hypothetical protein HMPREF9682_00799 [Streptococcus intermedius F0395]